MKTYDCSRMHEEYMDCTLEEYKDILTALVSEPVSKVVIKSFSINDYEIEENGLENTFYEPSEMMCYTVVNLQFNEIELLNFSCTIPHSTLPFAPSKYHDFQSEISWEMVQVLDHKELDNIDEKIEFCKTLKSIEKNPSIVYNYQTFNRSKKLDEALFIGICGLNHCRENSIITGLTRLEMSHYLLGKIIDRIKISENSWDNMKSILEEDLKEEYIKQYISDSK